MKQCYVGESFIQSFKIVKDSDATATVDAGNFEVRLDGEIVQAGTLAIAEDGHTVSFRFNSNKAGMHEIIISWRMGQDAWTEPFLMKVIQPERVVE